MDDNEQLRYNWREVREKRYLDAQWQIVLVCAIAGVALAVLSWVNYPPKIDKGREVSIAATKCFNEGLRAILHTDGSIECRP